MQTLNTRALDVNTVNGDVRISGWSGDRAHIRTLDGDLDLQTSLVKGGRYEIESHSGDINLSLPEQPGFELEAHTFSGRIRIDFPIKSEGPIRDTDRGPRSVRGTYGDGSSSLRLQTFNGNLTVTRQMSGPLDACGDLALFSRCWSSAFVIDARCQHAQDTAQRQRAQGVPHQRRAPEA